MTTNQKNSQLYKKIILYFQNQSQYYGMLKSTTNINLNLNFWWWSWRITSFKTL